MWKQLYHFLLSRTRAVLPALRAADVLSINTKKLSRRKLVAARGKREALVNADDGGDVRREFFAEPLGETPPCPIPPWARRGLNLIPRADTLSDVHPDSLATGMRRHRAGIVDAM